MDNSDNQKQKRFARWGRKICSPDRRQFELPGGGSMRDMAKSHLMGQIFKRSIFIGFSATEANGYNFNFSFSIRFCPLLKNHGITINQEHWALSRNPMTDDKTKQ